jgi:hypothetical protein
MPSALVNTVADGYECLNRFDAIVIGSGLGGLVAGVLYARGGHRVLVIERHDTFGGAATVDRHGSLSIEGSLHEIAGFDEGDPKTLLLKLLDLDRVPFVDVGDIEMNLYVLFRARKARPIDVDLPPRPIVLAAIGRGGRCKPASDLAGPRCPQEPDGGGLHGQG